MTPLTRALLTSPPHLFIDSQVFSLVLEERRRRSPQVCCMQVRRCPRPHARDVRRKRDYFRPRDLPLFCSLETDTLERTDRGAAGEGDVYVGDI